MMKLLILCSLLIAFVFGRNCGIPPQPGKPTLAIMTTPANQASYGASNGIIIASVFAGGKWAPWRILDNSKCDDFTPGKMSYFNDFVTVRPRWEAIALYTCSNDGLMLEAAGHWNGRGQSQTVGWEAGVFGPFGVRCVRNAYATDYNGDRIFSDIYLDGNYDACDGVIWRTGDPQKRGRIWTGKLPGVPNCGSLRGRTESKAMAPGNQNFVQPESPAGPSTDNNTYSAFEQQLLNYLMAVVGIALLLFVSNSCLMAYAIKNKNGGSSGGYYGKVAQTDIE